MSNWYSKTKDQILTDFKTNEQNGLTTESVDER
ncbi:ATPase, partial [Klebsiella pneumoniae]|nr:ATPase [Klebsiella pneumoniae]